MKNSERLQVSSGKEGFYFTTKNGCQLFIYEFLPVENYNKTVFIISGITGINHNTEKETIELLCYDKNRIVVIHPRGTGYSEGIRGDMKDFQDLINDFIEVITKDRDYNSVHHKIILFGHSMSTAVLLAVAHKLENVGGAVLINPPYKMRKAKGMSPGLAEYVKYAWYYLLGKHIPVVNMAGDPAKIENEVDREESESRQNDPLLVKYFSLYMMTETRKLLSSMVEYAKVASYPLLLIYGEKDTIVDQAGCDRIFDAWKCKEKQYVLEGNGSHGKSTVILSKEIICFWIDDL